MMDDRKIELAAAAGVKTAREDIAAALAAPNETRQQEEATIYAMGLRRGLIGCSTFLSEDELAAAGIGTCLVVGGLGVLDLVEAAENSLVPPEQDADSTMLWNRDKRRFEPA